MSIWQIKVLWRTESLGADTLTWSFLSVHRLLPPPWIQLNFGKICGDYVVNKTTEQRITMSIAVFVLFFTPWKHHPSLGFVCLYFLPRSWNCAGILSKVSTNPVKFGNAARFVEATPEPVLLKSLSGWNMDCFLRACGPWGLPSHPQMRVTVIQGATLLEHCTIIIVFPQGNTTCRRTWVYHRGPYAFLITGWTLWSV